MQVSHIFHSNQCVKSILHRLSCIKADQFNLTSDEIPVLRLDLHFNNVNKKERHTFYYHQIKYRHQTFMRVKVKHSRPYCGGNANARLLANSPPELPLHPLRHPAAVGPFVSNQYHRLLF